MTADILSVTTLEGPDASRVLIVTGEIDRDTRRHLSDAAGKVIADGHHRLILDLSGLSFCDSSGLSLLVDLHRETQTKSGWLRLVAASPVLCDMLRVTNLDRMFTVYDTVEAAAAT